MISSLNRAAFAAIISCITAACPHFMSMGMQRKLRA